MEYTKMNFKQYLPIHKQTFIEKKRAVASSEPSPGMLMEDFVLKLFKQYGYDIQRHVAEVDYLFGADFKLSWEKDGIPYSVHLDLTSNIGKRNTRWLDYMGEDSFNDSCFFGGNRFRACYGLKKKHPTGFLYFTPVYVMRIEYKELEDLMLYEQEFVFAIENLKRIHMESDRSRRSTLWMKVPHYLLGGNPQ